MQLRRGIFVALWAFACALLLAVPCAFALDTGKNGEVSGQSEEVSGFGKPQAITAVLYDDGELVIEGAASSAHGVTGQGVAASDSEKPPGDMDGTAAGATPRAVEAADAEKLASDASQTSPNGESAPSTTSLPQVAASSVTTDEIDGSSAVGSPASGGTPSSLQVASRTIVAKFDNVSVDIDRPEHASWYGCRDKIKSVTFGNGVTPDTLAYWFAGLENLSKVDLRGLDSSHTKSLRSLFDGCTSLQGLDLRTLNTSQVTDMSRLFAGCSSLEALNLSSFDTRKVTTMDGMFEGCASMRSLDLSKFDTRSLTSTNGMLKGCKSLSSLDVSSFSAGLVSAMAIPTNNAGGYWKLNTPAGFVSGVVLREPTAAERMAAGLSLDPFEHQGGKANRGSKSNDELVKPNSNAISELVTGTVSEAIALSAAPLLTPSSFLIAPEFGGLGAGAAFAQFIAQIQARPFGESEKPLVDTIADGYLAARGFIAKSFSRFAADAVEVVEEIATPSPANPMLPIGVPVNLFATTVLLLLVIPTTLLLLRDRR